MKPRAISTLGIALAFSIMLAAGSTARAGAIDSASGANVARVGAAGPQATDQVCDATADYFLGKEDYAEAIATHRRVLAERPADALAHYHLGFAYGMTGDREREIGEYRKAAALGWQGWDLYLNLGRALLEDGDASGAAAAFKTAVAIAPERPEGHYNLGLAYERGGELGLALDELQASLREDPRQPDAQNMMGLVYAEEHDYAHARKVWIELARTEPDFEPARLNLAILDHGAASPEERRASDDRNTVQTAFVSDHN